MNRNIIFIILLFSTATVFGQLSQGGTPWGFNYPGQLQLAAQVRMEPFDAEALIEEDRVNNLKKDRPYRFGKNFPVQLNLSNSGTWINLENGDRVWLLKVISPGAYSLNFTFSDFHLPEGTRMFVYGSDLSTAHGAFTHLNNRDDRLFATDLVQGSAIYIEYYEPRHRRGQGAVEISRITHAYIDVFKELKAFGSSGSCNMNVNCPQGSPWSDQKRAVVMLVSGGNGFCSGVLVNNTQHDGTPYILTADHCGSSGFATWVFRFNWEAAGCTNPATSPPFQSLTGSSSKASNSNSDFRLLELSNAIPASYNAYFAGWSRSTNPPASTVGIHHPSGDIKKISFDTDPATAVMWGGANCWEVSNWEFGTTTEPGSSGSPLFDQNGRVIGQLYGGSAACGNLLPDFYGRFSSSWNGTSSTGRLRDWLDPANSGVTFIDGFDPNAPSLAFDAGIASFLHPLQQSSGCEDTVIPVVAVKNFGINTLSSLEIHFGLSGSTLSTFNWSGSLASGASVSVTLPALQIQPGSNQLLAFAVNPNGNADMNAMNDTAFHTVNLLNPVTVLPPLTYDVQPPAFPATGWTVSNPDNGSTWVRTTTTGGFGNSSASVFIENFNYNAPGQRDYLITPAIDFSNVSSARLYFDVAYARFNSANHDSLIVSVSSDCGLNWTRVYNNGNLTLATNGTNNESSYFVPGSGQWRRDSAELGSFAGQDKLLVRFESVNGFGNNLYLDNINISVISGIPEYNAHGIVLYPNPSSGTIFLESDSPGDYRLYDAAGRMITKGRFERGKTQIKTHGTAGFYTMSILVGNTVITRKLLIQ